MANKFNQGKSTGAPTGMGEGKSPTFVEKAVGYPGVPGKTGPERSAGVQKVKVTAHSEGV